MKRLLLLSVLFASLAGCATRYTVVEIPPRIDLGQFETIGIAQFTSNSSDELNRSATEEFMKFVQRGQPGVRFLELGTPDELLKSVRHQEMNPAAIQEIGRKYNVSSLFLGRFQVSEVKPRLRITRDLSSVNASATVSVTMTTKHLDAQTGATIWTNSQDGEWPVAGLHKRAGTPLSIDMSKPEDRYGEFIQDLTHAVTDDFRSHFQKRKVG